MKSIGRRRDGGEEATGETTGTAAQGTEGERGSGEATGAAAQGTSIKSEGGAGMEGEHRRRTARAYRTFGRLPADAWTV